MDGRRIAARLRCELGNLATQRGVCRRSRRLFGDQPRIGGAETRLQITQELRGRFVLGELKLAIANIGTVTAGLLQSLNGKMKINLNNGTIEIFS